MDSVQITSLKVTQLAMCLILPYALHSDGHRTARKTEDTQNIIQSSCSR